KSASYYYICVYILFFMILSAPTSTLFPYTTLFRLRKFVNQKQSLYRLGGDEFVFILDETDKEKVTILVKRILTEMKRPIRMPNLQLLVTCSLGIAIDYVEEDEPYTLVRKANEAMYIARVEGKGTYLFYNCLME